MATSESTPYTTGSATFISSTKLFGERGEEQGRWAWDGGFTAGDLLDVSRVGIELRPTTNDLLQNC